MKITFFVYEIKVKTYDECVNKMKAHSGKFNLCFPSLSIKFFIYITGYAI